MSLIEIIGPVMIGPSSSHTAGAVRLGNIAQRLWGNSIHKVEIYLRGSFASTYWGHGTDKAILGGLLGMYPDDLRIRDAFDFAKEMKMNFRFFQENVDGAHPNSVRFIIGLGNRKMEIIGASTGGGAILIQEIDGFPVEINGELPTLIIFHQDKLGVVASIASALFQMKQNIAGMKLNRKSRGKEAIMVIEIDSQKNHLDILKNLNISRDLYNRIIFLPSERMI